MRHIHVMVVCYLFSLSTKRAAATDHYQCELYFGSVDVCRAD